MSSSRKEGGCETPGSGITPGFADGFVSTLRYSRNRGYALTLQQLLHTAVGCLLKTLHWPRSLAKHLHLRHGYRLAHHKCLVDLVDLGKLQDSRRDAFDYAMPRHVLVHRRRSYSSWSDAIRRLHPVR